MAAAQTATARASASPARDATLLVVEDVSVRFGGIKALDGISFDIPQGAVLGLIGPNGAGKTTLFNCLSRLYTPTSGDIRFEGRTILDRSAHDMAAIGMGRTFQNLASFARLSVRDNIRIGAHSQSRGDMLSEALGMPWGRREEARIDAVVDELLADLGLEAVAELPIAGLPFGTMKRVELARALAARPKLLLLDEPAGGLNHDEISELGQMVRALRDRRQLTVLLVEHHMNLVMGVSDIVVVLNFGRKIAEGTPASVQANPDVIHAYLGERK